MKLEKTTIVSIIVWMAGILAELMFHDIFTKSVMGVVLSIILALIILVLTYYVVDGLVAIHDESRIVMVEEQKELVDYQKKSQQEHQKKMMLRLDVRLEEQLELSKQIISYVSGGQPADELFQNLDNDEFSEPPVDKEMMAQLLEKSVSSINNNTVQVAKLLAKYQRQCNDDIQQILQELEEMK